MTPSDATAGNIVLHKTFASLTADDGTLDVDLDEHQQLEIRCRDVTMRVHPYAIAGAELRTRDASVRIRQDWWILVGVNTRDPKLVRSLLESRGDHLRVRSCDPVLAGSRWRLVLNECSRCWSAVVLPLEEVDPSEVVGARFDLASFSVDVGGRNRRLQRRPKALTL